MATKTVTMTTTEIYNSLRKKNKDLTDTDLSFLQSLISCVINGNSNINKVEFSNQQLVMKEDIDLALFENKTEAYNELCTIGYIIMQYIMFLDRGWPDDKKIVSIEHMTNFIEQHIQAN